MKKAVLIIISFLLVLVLSACDNRGSTTSSSENSSGGTPSVGSGQGLSADVGGDSVEIDDNGHFKASFEAWSEGETGKSDYIKYSFWFQEDGNAIVYTSHFKAMDKKTVSKENKKIINDSIANKETVWFSNSSGGSTFSWQELGVGKGAQFGGEAPENFDQLFTALSDYWRMYLCGDVCLVPTAVFGDNLETVHSFKYSVDPQTRAVTIEGESPFQSLVLNNVSNVGVCTVDGTLLRTEGVDYRFREYIDNK